LSAYRRSECSLKVGDFLPQNEAGIADDTLDRSINVRFDGGILRF
jgi:hypothetical protein